jgi:ParB-like chromosome segregation protein Spo0J
LRGWSTSRAAIANLMRLLALPQPVLKMIAEAQY